MRPAPIQTGRELLPPADPAFDRFWEDVHDMVELMGADRVILGLDWPHIEGLEMPLDYVRELKEFGPDEQRNVLLDNATGLNERRPA